MNLNIGKRIKELRNRRDITQEKLANYLNISCQAVSKWENGTAYPDITLLPPIANFFGVSTDELLGISQNLSNIELKQAETEYKLNQKDGKIEENIKLAREIVEKYPRNYNWILNLATALVSFDGSIEQIKTSKDNNYAGEAVALCERIKEDCASDVLQFEATKILCSIYPQMGRAEDAEKLAQNMPDMLSCKEFLLAEISSGEEKIRRNQKNLIKLVDLCASILVRQAFDKNIAANLSYEEKECFVDAANSLYYILFKEDKYSLLLNQRLAWNFRRLAELRCAQNQEREAMEFLLAAEESALAFDVGLIEKKFNYNSLFTNRCSYVPSDNKKSWQGSETSMLYYRTTEGVFDSLRKNRDFIRMQKRLKKKLGSFEKELSSFGETEG